MTQWIRVDVGVGAHDDVWKLGDLLHGNSADIPRGLRADVALACCIRVWSGVAQYRPDGDISGVSDDLLERWAGWSGATGAFAPHFRAVFASDGVVKGWLERQGKLLERAKKDRERKKPVADIPRKIRGKKCATIRNDINPYSPLFEDAWSAYPRRPNNSKVGAWEKWQARVAEGEPESVMLAGVRSYAAYVAREQVAPQFVKQAATFFGPKRPYRDEYGAVESSRRATASNGQVLLTPGEQAALNREERKRLNARRIARGEAPLAA